MRNIKFPYAIGYGLTETAPLICDAGPKRTHLGTTGTSSFEVQVRLADVNPENGQGELQVKGPNVTKFNINKTDKDELLAVCKERAEKRAASQDLNHPSCGSVFRNPEGDSAGRLIDAAGLKGYTIGGASVSMKHANFIINSNNATYTDIIKLIKYIKKQIKKIYNIDLVVEQQIIK